MSDKPGLAFPAITEKVSLGGWWMVIVLILLHLLNAFDRTILSLMVGHVKSDLAVSDTQIGLLLGFAFALCFGLSGIPMGMMVDRFDRRIVLFGGVILWSVATISCGFAASFDDLLAARMFLGIGEAALMPAAHSLLADKFPSNRVSLALSIFYLGAVFGNSLSVAIGGPAIAYFSQFKTLILPLVSSIRGWQAPFLVVGILGVALSFLCFSFSNPLRHRHDESKDTTAPSGVTWRSIFKTRGAVMTAILGSFVLYSIVLYAVVLWTPAYMSRAFGWPISRIGVGYAIVHLGGAGVGTVAAGLLVDRLVARGFHEAPLQVFAASLLVAGPVGVTAFLVADPYLFLFLEGLLFLIGFSYYGYAASMVQAIAPPEARGRMAALYLLAITIVGGGLGPTVIGFLTDNVFRNEADLGSSLALLLAVVTPVAFFAAIAGIRPMRAVVRR